MQKNINKAIIAHKEGRLIEAERLYLIVLKELPNHPEILNNLAIIQVHNSKLGDAEETYKKIIKIKPDLADAHNNLGGVFQKLNRFDEAIICYKKAIALKPDIVGPYFNMSNALTKIRKLDEAIIYYKKTIKIKPDFAPAHNNLGGTLYELNRLDESEEAYKNAIKFKPDYAEANNGLATVLYKLKRFDEAIVSIKKAIVINPNIAEAYNNLGIILHKLDKFDEAITAYNKALKLIPHHNDVLLNRGQLFFKTSKYELALKDFEKCTNIKARIRSLYTLYALNRIEDIYQTINKFSASNVENLDIAAFSSFISYKNKRDTSNKFCKNPIDFINLSNLSSHVDNSNKFITDIIEELHSIDTDWEPLDKSTIKGFQSNLNLFDKPSKKINNLKQIIKKELDLYLLKFNKEKCSFIKKWPSENSIRGWYVILKKQGYQTSHIHSSGWLSGVIYLKVVPLLDKNEGAIEFSLNGEHFSDVNSPKKIYTPNKGDIIFFPSSLHHRTIPFTTNEDRIIISFDLIPNPKKN